MSVNHWENIFSLKGNQNIWYLTLDIDIVSGAFGLFFFDKYWASNLWKLDYRQKLCKNCLCFIEIFHRCYLSRQKYWKYEKWSETLFKASIFFLQSDIRQPLYRIFQKRVISFFSLRCRLCKKKHIFAFRLTLTNTDIY